VQSVTPDAAPVGSMVQVIGIYLYDEEYYDNYQGVYIGNQLCELRDQQFATSSRSHPEVILIAW